MVSVHIFYFCYFAFCFISICYLPHLFHSSHFCVLSSSLTYLVPFLLCRASFVLPFNIFALLCVCVWRSRKVAVSAPRPMCLLCVQNNDQTSSATVQPEFSSVQLGSARSLSSGTESRVELSSLYALSAWDSCTQRLARKKTIGAPSNVCGTEFRTPPNSNSPFSGANCSKKCGVVCGEVLPRAAILNRV